MGTFGGHALPGSFFIIFSLWHAYNLFSRYFRSKTPGSKKFQTSIYFPTPCCRKLPLEPIITLALISVANFLEFITGFTGNGHFGNIGNGQHMIMFSFFGFTSFMAILDHYKVTLPPNALYLCVTLSFSIEALLFYWHLHIQDPMEVQVHTLLLYILVATIICVSVEMNYRNSIAPAFCRVYLIFFQGVWFWQVAFILYPPLGMKAWDWKDHHQMMIVTIIFSILCGLCLVVMMLLWILTALRFGQLRINERNNLNYVALPLMSVDCEDGDEKTFLNNNHSNGSAVHETNIEE